MSLSALFSIPMFALSPLLSSSSRLSFSYNSLNIWLFIGAVCQFSNINLIIVLSIPSLPAFLLFLPNPFCLSLTCTYSSLFISSNTAWSSALSGSLFNCFGVGFNSSSSFTLGSSPMVGVVFCTHSSMAYTTVP